MRLEEIASVVRPLGIPIMVDAASEHIERPSPWLRRGADLVIYSGGKFLRRPQTSGLLLGNKRLVEAAWRNGAPHQALGRPMKVSKEDIIGVLTALEYCFEERDPAAERRKWDDDLARIAELLARLDGISSEVLEPQGVDRVPRLKIVWDRAKFPLDGVALRQSEHPQIAPTPAPPRLRAACGERVGVRGSCSSPSAAARRRPERPACSFA